MAAYVGAFQIFRPTLSFCIYLNRRCANWKAKRRSCAHRSGLPSSTSAAFAPASSRRRRRSSRSSNRRWSASVSRRCAAWSSSWRSWAKRWRKLSRRHRPLWKAFVDRYDLLREIQYAWPMRSSEWISALAPATFCFVLSEYESPSPLKADDLSQSMQKPNECHKHPEFHITKQAAIENSDTPFQDTAKYWPVIWKCSPLLCSWRCRRTSFWSSWILYWHYHILTLWRGTRCAHSQILFWLLASRLNYVCFYLY